MVALRHSLAALQIPGLGARSPSGPMFFGCAGQSGEGAKEYDSASAATAKIARL
jgi:hypothetical protein